MNAPSFQAPAAVASNPPSLPANPPAALADEAGERGNCPCRFNGHVVGPILPCAGWTLMMTEEWDSEGFVTDLYYARSDAEDRLIHHSRFDFSPTQARFDWLVRNGFPHSPGGGPWTSVLLDAAMDPELAPSFARQHSEEAH